MGEAHRAFTSMDRVLQRTTTNSDNKVSKLIDQLKARTDEFTAATNKTMNAINPTETLVARMRAYGTACRILKVSDEFPSVVSLHWHSPTFLSCLLLLKM